MKKRSTEGLDPNVIIGCSKPNLLRSEVTSNRRFKTGKLMFTFNLPDAGNKSGYKENVAGIQKIF
ncbi:hypothetical protein ACTG4T_03650 [Enterococcus faecium]|uniref:hypothetical protein n=1 Tax=Enterococcus faecium TaxID=1352 RepID=UPI003F78E8CD